MTELYIDGVSAVLPKDFNIQVKRENPLFTKNGEYTYDITLPLTNATNANLYKHLNRLNSVEEVTTKRKAVLIADNRVYCNGTEIITGWTDESVSIQIAAGNSEMNYVIGNDLKISSLSKMTETLPVYEGLAVAGVKYTYPQTDVCFTMVYDRVAGEVINPWVNTGIGKTDITPGYLQDSGLVYPNLRSFVPQPYLCAFLKDLFKALGYTLTSNFLEETIYHELIICHTVRTRKWCKILPGWSVGDFLEQVELLFNGLFVVDNRNRIVRFLSKTTYYHAVTTNHVRWVEDVYEVETADKDDEPEAVNIMQSDVRYGFPDNTYWRRCCLPDSVKAAASKGEIPVEVDPPATGFINRMYTWFTDHRDENILWTDLDTGRTVFFYVETVGSKDILHWQLADEFASIQRENAEQEVELEIMPVEIGQADVTFFAFDEGGGTVTYSIPMPAIDGGSGNKEENNEAKAVADLLENSSSDSDSESKSKIFLAFYSGLVMNMGVWCDYMLLPLAYTDEYAFIRGVNEWIQTNTEGKTLRLTDLQPNLWEGSSDIDQRNEIKLTSYDPNLYDPRAVFEIRNKRYVCKEIEYTLDANGRKGAWTGNFYPAKISDTEADARWILADGKWRDGGVWLDNGRWLDS